MISGFVDIANRIRTLLLRWLARMEEEMADQALLRSASISYHTNDDDKDFDTNVTVTVRDRSGHVVASFSGDVGVFHDQSDSGPFDLLIEDLVSRGAIRGGSTTIRIDPNGNDTWRFNFALRLIFDDGSTLSSRAAGVDLNESRQQITVGIA